MRDQHADIREWLHHHAALGVSKFYVFDNNSSSPMLSQLEDFVLGGFVEYHFLTSFRHHSNKCGLFTVCLQGCPVGCHHPIYTQHWRTTSL